jgi:hypothetical protein
MTPVDTNTGRVFKGFCLLAISKIRTELAKSDRIHRNIEVRKQAAYLSYLHYRTLIK